MFVMEPKDYVAIALMLLAIPTMTFLATVSQKGRDGLFFLLLVTAVIPDKLAVNFVSRFYYYRGTTRGFEISLVDLIALSLLVAALIVPRKDQSRVYLPGSLLFLLLYAGYCAFSITQAEFKIVSAFELTKVFRSVA